MFIRPTLLRPLRPRPLVSNVDFRCLFLNLYPLDVALDLPGGVLEKFGEIEVWTLVSILKELWRGRPKLGI